MHKNDYVIFVDVHLTDEEIKKDVSKIDHYSSSEYNFKRGTIGCASVVLT